MFWQTKSLCTPLLWDINMACNGVLTPPAKVPPKSITLVLKYFNPPQSSNFLLPSDWKWLLLHFSHMATSNKHMLIFLIKCCHNWFLKKLKQYIKETCSYHHACLFYDLSFINTTQKRVAAKYEMQVALKKVYWKNNRVFQTFAILSLKKMFYQNLTDAFFKYL